MPKISVLMTLYNSAETVRSAVDSILQQTFTDFELIIVDDGSSDNGLAIVQSYSDPRVKTFRQENQGLAKALNACVKHATGEYLARQDPDDYSVPERFSKQVEYLDSHSDVAMVSSHFYMVDVNGSIIGLAGAPTQNWALRWETIFRNPFGHSTIMIRRSVMEALGGYYPAPAEDYELWTRLIQHYATGCIPIPLVYWLSNPKGISSLRAKEITEFSQQMGQRSAHAFLGHELNDQTFARLIDYWLMRRENIKNEAIISAFEDLMDVYKEFVQRNPVDRTAKQEIRAEILRISLAQRKWLRLHNPQVARKFNRHLLRYFGPRIFLKDIEVYVRRHTPRLMRNILKPIWYAAKDRWHGPD